MKILKILQYFGIQIDLKNIHAHQKLRCGQQSNCKIGCKYENA